MINQFLLICSGIVVYEFLIFISFIGIIKLNIKYCKKLIKLFVVNKISDTKKEKLILVYSKKLFLVSIKILFVLFSILAFILILNHLSDSFINLIFSIFGILELIIILITYYLIKKLINAKL